MKLWRRPAAYIVTLALQCTAGIFRGLWRIAGVISMFRRNSNKKFLKKKKEVYGEDLLRPLLRLRYNERPEFFAEFGEGTDFESLHAKSLSNVLEKCRVW
jgi:hypothetical protein